MSYEYRGIIAYRGKWCALIIVDGERKRLSLGNLAVTGSHESCENYPAAERAASELRRQLARPVGETAGEIFKAYLADKAVSERPLVDGGERPAHAWKALEPFFGALRPEEITRETSREYIKRRRGSGRADGTIRKEMSTLRAALRWHDKNTPAVFEMPSPPPSRDRWLTRNEFARLLEAASDTFHLTVFLHLAIATAARKEAILTMTWPQVRWERNEIWLGVKPNGKKRATVPMTPTLRAVLSQARDIALTERVVEFKGEPIKSIRTAFNRAVRAAKLSDVHIHDLRHTAGVWMTEAGVSMHMIKDFMGHSDVRVTTNIYARHAPAHLVNAASAVDVGQCVVVHVNQKR